MNDLAAGYPTTEDIDPLTVLRRFGQGALSELLGTDPELARLLAEEHCRQARTLSLVASSGLAFASVLAALGPPTDNLTTEGFPGARYHAGAEVADQIERLAVARARRAFHASFANVQPHSCTTANQAVLFSLLKPGDTVLSLSLDAGGHLSHGAPVAAAGRYFHVVPYGVGRDGHLDFDEIHSLAKQCRPQLIIAGTSSFPRAIDFARFRSIADDVGCYLLADISHIAGLVVTGLHSSPIDHAHITTTSTYKQLGGPHGGLILSGRDAFQPVGPGRTTLAEHLQRAVFPFFQGTPSIGTIAAKARALDEVTSESFRRTAQRMLDNATALANGMAERGFELVTGGTDTHLLLLRLRDSQMTGLAAQDALERCGVIVNKNLVPGDTRSALTTSGLRLGTNTVAFQGMEPAQMQDVADILDRVLSALEQPEGRVPCRIRDQVLSDVAALCAAFPRYGWSVNHDRPVPVSSRQQMESA